VMPSLAVSAFKPSLSGIIKISVPTIFRRITFSGKPCAGILSAISNITGPSMR